MSKDDKNNITTNKTVTYLNKDFDGFRRDLLQYAQTYFPDRIRDFSEASAGGMFLEMAAYVGDVMSFYLDHQFSELNPSTASELKNIHRHLKQVGIKGAGPSPAIVEVKITAKVSAVLSDGEYIPDRSGLPEVRKNSLLSAVGGITFTLTEDIDFSQLDRFGDLLGEVEVSGIDSSGNPSEFRIVRNAVAISGQIGEKKLKIGTTLVKFRKVSLDVSDVTEILSVVDSEGNNYYEVESLAQDTVFRSVLNGDSSNSDLVPENIQVIPAPYRYTRDYDLTNRVTTLRFGGGLSASSDNDVLPDPSALSLPLYGKKQFSRFSIDPNSLLKTKTLGVAPVDTTLIITYRHGGGLKHNVGPGGIRSVKTLDIRFPHRPSQKNSQLVRRTLGVYNPGAAGGGAPAPSIEDLKSLVPSHRNSQLRMVSKEDLLSRIYTMPTNFGRVFRAGISSNPNNPLSSILYVISRDKSGKLVVAPDALKKNLATYLNEFRLVSDSLDILDAKVINIQLKIDIVVDSNQNSNSISAILKRKLTKFFSIKNFQIEQPIIKSDIIGIILSTRGVLSFNNLSIMSVSGEVMGLKYSSNTFNVEAATKKGLVFPPKGAIFEMKYPSTDIIIYAG